MRPPQDLIFPRNPEEFYRLRDDRTNRCVANRGYQSIRTSVSIDSDVARTISGQAMMLTTCNLLSRWCRRVGGVCPLASAGIPLYLVSVLLKDVCISTTIPSYSFGSFFVSSCATLPKPLLF